MPKPRFEQILSAWVHDPKVTMKNLSALKIVVLIYLLLGHVFALAQPSRAVPAYQEYMKLCRESPHSQATGIPDSLKDKVLTAGCQCKFEHFPKVAMTERQFSNAVLSCREERARVGADVFSEKYRNQVQGAVAIAPEEAFAGKSIGQGRENVILGADCTVKTVQYGSGTWSWANAGIFITLKSKKQIALPHMETPYADARCMQ